MSDREKVIQIINEIPDYRIGYIIPYLQGYLQGMTDGEEIPNAETLEAFAEIDEMKPVNPQTMKIMLERQEGFREGYIQGCKERGIGELKNICNVTGNLSLTV